MNPFFYSEEAGAKGLLPLSPAPPIRAEPASASLRTISLDDSEHLLHNHHVSVASLRLLFTFAPEGRSASLRNQRSPSPEYPICSVRRSIFGVQQHCAVRSLRTGKRAQLRRSSASRIPPHENRPCREGISAIIYMPPLAHVVEGLPNVTETEE